MSSGINIEVVEILNKLILGDCLEAMKLIPDNSVDLVLTDPPYGITKNKWDTPPDLPKLWEQLLRVGKERTPYVIFSQQPFTADLVNSNRKMFKYEWIYKKKNAVGFLNAHKMPLRAHENICVFYKKQPIYNPQFTQGKPYKRYYRPELEKNYGWQYADYIYDNKDGKRYPVDVLTINNGRRANKTHTTYKPIELNEYMIKTYTNEGMTVLDPFMGCGSSGVAAVNLGREYIGIEMLQEYYDVAVERINAVDTAPE